MITRSTSEPSSTLKREHFMSTHYVVLSVGLAGYVAAIRAAPT